MLMRHPTAAVWTVLLLAGGSTAVAQVGHPPDRSPYRDLPYGRTFEIQGGYFGGAGGNFGLGPHDGTTYGARADFRISNPLQLGFSVTYDDLNREVVIPYDSIQKRFKGSYPTSVIMIEGVMQFNLTGRKTWHNLAPYITGSFGIAFGGDVGVDSSAYNFGTKAVLAPGMGVRWFLTRKLFIRLETKWNFWKLSYPAGFAFDPPGSPGTPPGSNALIRDGHFTDWTGSFRGIVGLGYPLPF
jgi:hypothetical protein